MQYNQFPGTRLSVSNFCLGTMTFGGQTKEEIAQDIIHYALDCGINFIDTADIYPDAGGRSGAASEIAVGKAIKDCREDIILATKIRYPMGTGLNNRGLSRRHILRGIDESLKRLQTDYVDIYYLHAPDWKTPLEETLYTMDSLVRAGKIRYYGFANFPAWLISDALALADRRGYAAPVVTQNVYNLLTRSLENELLPCAKAHRLAVTIYNPLCGGLLTGKHDFAKGPAKNTRFADDPDYMDRYWTQENFQAIDKLKALAAGAGMSMTELSLRWCLSQDSITSALIGCSKLEQLQANIQMVEKGALPQNILDSCDEIWKQVSGNRFYYTNQRQD